MEKKTPLYQTHVDMGGKIVEFGGFLRPQVKFEGPDQLVDELKRNVEETKRLTA